LEETMEEDNVRGIGRVERRQMVRRWKAEGNGLSLRAWARKQSPVGDSAFVWLEAKRVKRRGRS
jgi:hypothetical protein